MKNSKKDFSNAGQSIPEAQKSQKHDANLQKNSTLYFQIGLILCLLGTYALFEMQFQEKKLIIDTVETNELATIDVVEKFRVEPEVVPETKQNQAKQTVLIDKIIEVDNELLIKDPVDVIISDPKTIADNPVKVDDITVIDEPNDLEPVPFAIIEKVPVYPGCENKKTNEDRKKCMSDKITKLIGKKFNVGIGSEYGISGRQRITTQFTIDKTGNVTNIKIRGPHQALENEAKRVINQIPQMEPGLQRQVPVGVIYTLPIVYDARN